LKKYFKEIIILILQLFMFYIFPMFAGPTDAIGMVLIILLATFAFSLVIGAISNNKRKYTYPIFVAIIFIPSVFIYYNESALIHSIWYLVDSYIGLFIGSGLNILTKKLNKKGQ